MRDVHPLRVIIKALILFVIANLAFAYFNPLVGRLTIYNRIIPGRLRFPFSGDEIIDATTDDLDALFASHVISMGPKPTDEFRVIVIGDSSVWGILIPPDQTLPEQLNAIHAACDGKTIHAFNLGYPHPSVLKDFVILNAALKYKPDLVLWLVTLNTFSQTGINPFLASNQEQALSIVNRYNIPFSMSNFQLPPTFFDLTIIGQRSRLARIFLLQLYGLYWADIHLVPSDFRGVVPVENNFQNNQEFPPYKTDANLSNSMPFSWVDYVYKVADGIPTVVVNEPIFIGTGQNSDIRYNSLYPRWAYDQYRNTMELDAVRGGWDYVDRWNYIPSSEFLDSPLHLTSNGERQLAASLIPVIQGYCKH